MASKETGGRAQRSQQNRDEEGVEATADNANAKERKEAVDSDVETILDEIDDVLEENAEDFVRSYVQKGGQ